MGLFDKKSNKLIGYGLIAIILISIAIHELYFKPPIFDQALVKIANEINKTCPIMVNKDIRLDNTVFLTGNSFQCNYTLIHLDKDSVDTIMLRKKIEIQLLNLVKNNPNFQLQRRLNSTLIFGYNDRNGKFIFKIEITPEMYNK